VIKSFVARNFRGSCSSVEMLKGYILICQYAEGVHGQRKVENPCTRCWAFRWQRHSETTAISIFCSKQAASFFFPMLERSEKSAFSFLLYMHVCITILAWFLEGIHTEIAGGLELWFQGSVQPAVASEC